jgi:hypothetical protein
LVKVIGPVVVDVVVAAVVFEGDGVGVRSVTTVFEGRGVAVPPSSSSPPHAAKKRVAGSAATRNRRGSMFRVMQAG